MQSPLSDIPDSLNNIAHESTKSPASTWQSPLPDDEIARQQAMMSRLHPGMRVGLEGLGNFIYNGVWDTMHTFYPAGGQDLPAMVTDPTGRRYLKRDLRGQWYVHLPYTLLADRVIIPDGSDS